MTADLLPASAACGVDAAERQRGRHGSDAEGGAFPWQEDETGSRSVAPASWAWLPPVAVGHTSSLLHEVVVIIRPSVGKAVALWSPAENSLQRMRALRSRSVLDPSTGKLVDPDTGELVAHSAWSLLDDVERAEANIARATDRASSTMADYMVHNRLTKMWVLTFREALHGPEGRKIAMQRTAAFMRRVRRDFYRGKAFPYVYSPELHPQGHGWHVNVFLRSDFISKHSMQRSWGHGNVWFTDFMGDRFDWIGRRIGAVRVGRQPPTARAARKAARYAAKYAQKDWATENIGPGAHRYERAEGFPVPEIRVRVKTFADAMTVVAAHPSFGQMYTSWALDFDTPGWCGPPMRGVLYDHGAPASGVKGSKKGKSRRSGNASGSPRGRPDAAP